MKTIRITASKSYDVVIGSNILPTIGRRCKELTKARKCVIVTDSNVFPLYAHTVEESLLAAGLQVLTYTFPAGEASKNGQTYLSLLDFLAANHVTRTDLLIALGGGVVGDMTGFAAATFLRGISYIQIPTSLLAMVDSSVGGKTAIDLPSGKNLAGAFYQPLLVLCDIDVLKTLPGDVFRDGCAEVIKYGVLFEPELFSHLYETGLSFDAETVVARCVELKRDVVAEDEFDRGNRQKLNLGHTIGHAIEARSNFAVTHGQAVAMGMAIVGKSASKLGICSQQTYRQILEILIKFGLPTQTDATARELYTLALSDKKSSGSSINLIVPVRIGLCNIQNTKSEDLEAFIEAGL